MQLFFCFFNLAVDGGVCSVGTWCGWRAVRLHQFLLGNLFAMPFTHIVLLGHQWVVERCLTDGAEAVWVGSVAATRLHRAAGILSWHLLQCGCWCCSFLRGNYSRDKQTIMYYTAKFIKRKTLDEFGHSVLTWDLKVDGFHPQVLCVNFTLVVRLGHDRTGERHVANMTTLQPVRVSVVTVCLINTHKEMSWMAEH